MKQYKRNIAIVIGIILVTIISVITTDLVTEKYSNNNSKANNLNYIYAKGRVEKIYYNDTDIKDKGEAENYLRKQELDIKILKGNHKGEVYKIRNVIETIDVYHIIVEEKDKVLLNMIEDENGELVSIHIYERDREFYVYLLIFLFVISLAIIGGKKGIKSAITLFLTGVLIIKVLLPLILYGFNPVVFTILICTLIIIITFIVINGINKKTITAILGTLGGVLIAGILSQIVGTGAKITGLAGEHAKTLAFLHKNNNLDFKGILFAAIIIGALGAVMDVCMSIASSMSEIIEIKPNINKKRLIKAGMNIGKDIMGTMSNTLILAYAGGSLQLLLLLMAQNIGYVQMINLDMINAEIITALSGSIGLIWSVPITVLVGAVIYSPENSSEKI